jgi:hypothetical protein
MILQTWCILLAILFNEIIKVSAVVSFDEKRLTGSKPATLDQHRKIDEVFKDLSAVFRATNTGRTKDLALEKSKMKFYIFFINEHDQLCC